MARCEEGYRCDVCGGEVEFMTDSDLYLRYILGEVPIYELHRTPERHIRCNPAVAQYITDEAFPPVECPGDFSRTRLPADFTQTEERRVTAAWRRLQELPTLGLAIDQYPIGRDRS